jgi:predicted DNA-binding transcriptional regulator YafY
LRDFRVDRIMNLKITEKCGSLKDKNELKKYFAQIWQEANLNEVCIWFDKSVVSSLVSVKYYFGYIDQIIKDEGVEMNFAVNDFYYIARWLLSFGEKIKIMKPPELKDILTGLVQNLAHVYLSNEGKINVN